MEILVCIKQVPGTNKVEIDPVTGVLKREGANSKMNPYDLYALETALRLKEKHGGNVKVITMGPPQAEAVLREAFAMGADEGVLLSDRSFAGSDVLATSYTLAQAVKKLGHFDIILCGKQTTDGDTAQVGPALAEHLGIPHIVNVLRILEVKEKSLITESDMTDTVQTAMIGLPCLLTVEKDIFQPRLPSYRKKLDTKGREIMRMALDDLEDKNELNYGISGSPTQVEKIFPPETGKNREMWTGGPEQLSRRMYEKLRQLKFI